MRACCHGRMVEGASIWNIQPGFNSLLGHHFYQTKITSNLADINFFLDTTKSLSIFSCSTLRMIRGYQVSFSVKTSQKKHFPNIISKRARYLGCQKNFLGQNYFDIIWGDQPLKTPKWTKTKISFFDGLSYGATSLISTHKKRDKYIDIVSGYHPPGDPPSGHLKHQFLNCLT